MRTVTIIVDGEEVQREARMEYDPEIFPRRQRVMPVLRSNEILAETLDGSMYIFKTWER